MALSPKWLVKGSDNMWCTRHITDDLLWIGANDRRLAMFEGVYSVPRGVSYNSYLLLDEKTVLFDTVDKAVQKRFLENLEVSLNGRPLHYFVVQHMEPDHSSVLAAVLAKHPEAKLVCNAKTLALINQFNDYELNAMVVAEGDALQTGRHTLHFVMAPMVHWPEVMMTYDSTDKVLFSADAFGTFGALNGALFADEVDFQRDYLDEARRYYSNIVGKYGTQVQAVLQKAAGLEIGTLCPLHGFVWRQNLGDILEKYNLWSSYQPEEYGVVIAYASVYGNTENAVEILASTLRQKGVHVSIYDVSVTHASEIIAASFRWSHLVFASTTYNAGIFVAMEHLLTDLVAHNLQNRTVALLENGSWAPTSGDLMCKTLARCKNISFIPHRVSIRSSLKPEQRAEIEELAEIITQSVRSSAETQVTTETIEPSAIDPATLFKISYGLYLLTASEAGRDNGCIINTTVQITANPPRISIAVNKNNLTHDMIMHSKEFNISTLSVSAPFSLFEQFGYHSGRETDKFADSREELRTANGIRYLKEHANGVISGRVRDALDYGTHTVFIADVSEAMVLAAEASVTYQYYFDHIKPKPQQPQVKVNGFICRICGYVHEGDSMPDDFECPLCKHGPQDFERIK